MGFSLNPGDINLRKPDSAVTAGKMEIRLGDIVRLKKKHPCGNDEWEVVRVGAGIRIRCLKCQRYVLLERGVFERRVRAVLSTGDREGPPSG